MKVRDFVRYIELIYQKGSESLEIDECQSPNAKLHGESSEVNGAQSEVLAGTTPNTDTNGTSLYM